MDKKSLLKAYKRMKEFGIKDATIEGESNKHLLTNQPESHKRLLKVVGSLHQLVVDPQTPNHLKQHLLDHMSDLEEILGIRDEDLENEGDDDSYDNNGIDYGEIDDKESEDLKKEDKEQDSPKDPDEQSQNLDIKKSILFKATTMPEDQSKKLQSNPFKSHYEEPETKHLGHGLFLHSSKKKTGLGNDSIIHHISSSEDPKDKESQIAQGALIHFLKDGHEFPSVSSVKTKPGMEGKGFGKLLYHAMIKHHGGILSDTVMSQGDQQVWNSLSKHPDLKMKHAREGNADHTEGRHSVEAKLMFEPDIPGHVIHREPKKESNQKSEFSDEDDEKTQTSTPRN